jgi:hypothetical protein
MSDDELDVGLGPAWSESSFMVASASFPVPVSRACGGKT